MRRWFSIVAMLTIAPVVAATTLNCFYPESFGGLLNPLSIAGMAIFGLVTVPLWPTYIPSIILVSWLMNRISVVQALMRIPLPVLIGLSVLIGSLGGMLVMMPVVVQSQCNALGWIMAGTVSGAITLPAICIVHRYVPQSSNSDASVLGAKSEGGMRHDN
jgi:hypothetical protein